MCVAQGPGRVKKCLRSRAAKLRLVHRTWRGRMGQGGSPQPRRLIKAGQAPVLCRLFLSKQCQEKLRTYFLRHQRSCVCENKQTKLKQLIKWYSSVQLTFYPPSVWTPLQAHAAVTLNLRRMCVQRRGGKGGDGRWGMQQPPDGLIFSSIHG